MQISTRKGSSGWFKGILFILQRQRAKKTNVLNDYKTNLVCLTIMRITEIPPS